MKNIIIAVLGIILALLVAGKAYSGNAEKIADIPVEYGVVYKIYDGNTRCYVYEVSGYGGGISCVRVK